MSSGEQLQTGGPIELGDFTPPATGPATPVVYVNGTQEPAPVIAAGAANVVSTGAPGTYALNFGVSFASGAVLTAIAGLDQANGNVVVLALVNVGLSNFQFDMVELIPGGSQAVPIGHQVTVEWLAIGQ